MTFLHRLSVRAILNAVTLTLAAALCASLLVPIGAAWRAVADADGLAALAAADRGVFEAMTAIRIKRGAVQTAIQAQDDALSTTTEVHAGILAQFNSALAAAQQVAIPDADKLLATARARWSESEALWRDVDAVARKPKAERDLKPTQPWDETVGAAAEHLSRRPLATANEVRLTDPTVAAPVAARQAAGTARANSGHGCPL